MMETGLRYLSGFGSHHETEAVAGALPVGQNSPQETPFGLYAEQFSATAFTAPRAQNLRSWLYRLRPSAMHPAFRRMEEGLLHTGPCREAECGPNRLRWAPLAMPDAPTDFVAGLATLVDQRRRAHAGRNRGARLSRQPVDGARVRLLRRRTARRAAGGRARDRHRVRPPRRGPGRDRRRSARREVPRRRRGPRARLRLRELRRGVAAAGTRADRRQRARQSARLPRARWRPSRTATPGRRWS